MDRLRALKALKEMSDALSLMHVRGQLPAKEYKKGLMSLAHDLIELGEREDAVTLVARLDSDYVNEVLPGQMEADPIFKVVATALGKFLRESANPVDVDLEQALLTHVSMQTKPC
jgi:hypothetical protein